MAANSRSVFLSMSNHVTKSEAEESENDHSTTFNTAYAVCTFQGKSLNIQLSSLNDGDKEQLTRFLGRKLNNGSVLRGGITTVHLCLGGEDMAHLCYHHGLKIKTLADPDAADKTDDSDSYLILCLIAPVHAQIDLFKADLDLYCANLFANPSLSLEDIDTLSKQIQSAVENWYHSLGKYLSNGIQRLQGNTKYLIYAALTDADLVIKCPEEDLCSDIKRLFSCCSLCELLNNSGDKASAPASDELSGAVLVDLDTVLSSGDQKEKHKPSITLTIDGETCSLENQGCTKFCEDWSDALEMCDVDKPIQIRQVIESYRLKVIQDMNTLKRLVKQAEADHYALYRCYMFLRQCGNGPVLLQHVDQDLDAGESIEATDILKILREFLTCDSSTTSVPSSSSSANDKTRPAPTPVNKSKSVDVSS